MAEAKKSTKARATRASALKSTMAATIAYVSKYTVGDVLIHVSLHTAHHIGQVITLRQQLGAWPPPAGSWTW